MKHNIRSVVILAALAGVLAVTAALALAAPAHASSTPTVKPGSSCATVGQTGTHNGDRYVCQQKKTDRCPVWHHVPQSGAHSTPWSHGPCPKCPTPTPTATATAVTTPTVQPTHPSPSHTTTAPATHTTTAPTAHSPAVAGATGTTATLPVTGPSAAQLLIAVGVGLLAIIVGVVALIAGRRRTP